MSEPSPEASGEIRIEAQLRNGRIGQAIVERPDVAEYPDRRPLVLLIPGGELSEIERGSWKSLSHALAKAGFATYRFKRSEEKLELQEVIDHYRTSLEQSGVNRDRVTLLGFRDSADLIEREYYYFYPVNPMIAAVLLAPTVGNFHLNNLTCPFLVLHGEADPIFNSRPPEVFESAVYRHLMRYGDLSACYRFPSLGKTLGEPEFADEVIFQIVEWLKPAVREGHRPQEFTSSVA